MPSLQTGGGIVYFLKTQLGARVPSTAMVAPMSDQFVKAIERFVDREGIDLVTFEKGQRKDDVAQDDLARFAGDEGVLFIGKAQEKARVFRTEKRRDVQGKTYPWIIRSTAWSITTTSTSSTATSGPSSSSSAPTFRIPPSSV